MGDRREKVVVAMSGGVDSSVAACLLHEQGYEVMGFFMRVGGDAKAPGSAFGEDGSEKRSHQGCCSASDASDARFVAGKLGVPFYALNFEKDFDGLIDYFADEYARGRTPNPCVMCNHKLKFGKLLEYADAVGARWIATGHYARVGERAGPTPGRQRVLLRGVDGKKDQSYVLYGIRRKVLDRVMFPIGGMVKDEVREHARRFGLPNAEKPDSVEICFVPDRDYARVVKERRPEAFSEGDVVDETGSVVGRHEGVAQFTIGQRRGLGIAMGEPVYVTQLHVASNTVTIGGKASLMKPGLVAHGVNLLVDGLGETFRADVKIRYLHKAASGLVTQDGTVATVRFDEPQMAPTPGQAVVFYDGDVVLGGGWIDRALDD